MATGFALDPRAAVSHPGVCPLVFNIDNYVYFVDRSKDAGPGSQENALENA